MLLNSTKEVLDILAYAHSIYRQKQDQVHIVTYAHKRYRLTRLLEQKGLDTALNKYTFQAALIEKQLDDVLLLYYQYVASVKLTKALGGGYCENDIPLVKRTLAEQ